MNGRALSVVKRWNDSRKLKLNSLEMWATAFSTFSSSPGLFKSFFPLTNVISEKLGHHYVVEKCRSSYGAWLIRIIYIKFTCMICFMNIIKALNMNAIFGHTARAHRFHLSSPSFSIPHILWMKWLKTMFKITNTHATTENVNGEKKLWRWCCRRKWTCCDSIVEWKKY